MELINRDASDKYEGFRYQKFRLAKKMLELIRENPRTNIVAIPEYRDDGYLVGEDGKQILEQNKKYSKNFTFISEEVRKSIVNFLDNYYELNCDPFLHFVFFTNVDYAGERKSEFLGKLSLTPLTKPVLEYLITQQYGDDVTEFISKVVLHTYENEYRINSKKPNTYKGYYRKILQMKSKDWIQFLKQVTFQFGEGDLEQLVVELDAEIKECKSYKIDHVNREEQVRSYLLEKIDMRMAEKHVTQKMLTYETVRNVFLEVSSRISSLEFDELHVYWREINDELDEGNKYRNLRDKINAVCSSFKEKTMKRYNREATTVRDEIKKYDKRQINALRYRVYESMERYFDDFYFKDKYTHEELKSIVKDIKDVVVNDIESLKKDFDYGVKNNITVQKIVLLLIDECFYSFDEE
ncbi:hypothetical protein [Halobacillus hunanensis]|uniref:hypothetical protein n=1 Tax=Halobacillus hunanensis TaxID=578214 RepID=UPI0009A668C0|nr:hypothetical protein [Halobacillus hunanensis]